MAGTPSAILSRVGLAPALRTLTRRCTVPVDHDLPVDQRLPDTVEVGAYYVVAEALTNAAKCARASVVEVCAQATNGHLRLEIRDDRIGLKKWVTFRSRHARRVVARSHPVSSTAMLVTPGVSWAVMAPLTGDCECAVVLRPPRRPRRLRRKLGVLAANSPSMTGNH
jgi:hypothetical protein